MEVDNDDKMTSIEDTQLEAANDDSTQDTIEEKRTDCNKDEMAANNDKMLTEDKKSECEDLEDPLKGVQLAHNKTFASDKDLLATPTHQRQPEATPISSRRLVDDGVPTSILRHISQFDSPSTASKVSVCDVCAVL